MMGLLYLLRDQIQMPYEGSNPSLRKNGPYKSINYTIVSHKLPHFVGFEPGPFTERLSRPVTTVLRFFSD